MKKIFMAGLMVVLMLGLIGLIFKVVVMDFLAGLFRTGILLFAPEPLVIPLALVFTVMLVIFIGFPASKIRFQGLANRFLDKVLPKEKHGVLVEKSSGTYDMAISIKKIEFVRLNGEIATLHLLYYPSAPTVWSSGLPIGLADEEKIIPIDCSDHQVYTIIATFGRNAPDTIREIEKDKSTE